LTALLKDVGLTEAEVMKRSCILTSNEVQ